MAERVWDKFLTEQDKAHLAASRHSRIGFGTRPALLLIDLYRWVFGDEPEPLLESIKKWPGSCGMAGWESLPHIQKLLETAREVGMPVVHVTGLDADGFLGWSEAAHRDSRHPAKDKENPDPEAQDRLNRRYDIVDEVAPGPGEPVFRKSSPSAFWGTPLVGHLKYLDVDTLIVAGESTSGCVRASVVDGTTNRFRMVVAEECVFDRHQAAHAINLFDMDQKYADVLAVDEVIAWMRQWKAQQAEKKAEPVAVPAR